MSYDYFLWLTNRRLESGADLDETAVLAWPDIESLREALSQLHPELAWHANRAIANDPAGTTTFRRLQLPAAEEPGSPLVVRTSHRDDSREEIVRLAQSLHCLALDSQSGEIVWQPDDD